jgi:antitoxin component of MazEF toxin-antitoxin module
MFKKLTKTGNSLALVLDRPLLERVKIDADTQLEVSTDGRCIIIAPVPDKRRKAAFRAAAERVNEKFAGAFARLAK